MVNYHHHVLHVGRLGHIIHVTHVDHLHIIAQAQCYCFLSILYNSGQMQLERRKVKDYKLLCLYKKKKNYTKQDLAQRPVQCPCSSGS